MLTVSFPLRANTMKSASYEYRKMSARRRAQFVPIGMPTVCWKTFPVKTTKILSTSNSSILMMSSSEYLFLESECSFTKYVSSCLNTKYLYLRLPFLKMKAFLDNTCESVFQFLVRYGCTCKKSGQIKRLDGCYMVKSLRSKILS